MKKIAHYRLPVSLKFPATHPRRGEPTHFKESIINGLAQLTGEDCKIHTIRNSLLWIKRIEKVLRDEAVLELYYWSGSPYNYKKDGSKPVVFATLDKDSGIGTQKLLFNNSDIMFPKIDDGLKCYFIDVGVVSQNDGLSLKDFKAWFKGYDLSKEMVIIHSTAFRY